VEGGKRDRGPGHPRAVFGKGVVRKTGTLRLWKKSKKPVSGETQRKVTEQSLPTKNLPTKLEREKAKFVGWWDFDLPYVQDRQKA